MKDKRTKAMLLEALDRQTGKVAEFHSNLYQARGEREEKERELKELRQDHENLKKRQAQIQQSVLTATAMRFPGIDLTCDNSLVYHNSELIPVREESEELRLLRLLFSLCY